MPLSTLDSVMANNYLQFSFQISSDAWPAPALQRLLDLIEATADDPNADWVCSAELEEAGLWLYAEEGADPDLLANLIQQVMAEFALTIPVEFTWACTCSKMRLDEFSGGGVRVTATEQLWWVPLSGPPSSVTSK